MAHFAWLQFITNQNRKTMKTKCKFLKEICAIALMVAVIVSCNYDPKAGLNKETPTRGNIKIGVDESFFLLSEAELYTFQSIYEFAHIKPVYKPEIDIWNDFLNDSFKTIITSRKLSTDEIEYFKSRNIYPNTVLIAYDGISFILNKSNKDSVIGYNEIKGLFTGDISKWSQLTPNSNMGNIKVVFDNNKSSTVRYIREKFGIKDSLPKHCYAVNNNEEVINYVEKNKNAIGVVGVNWISDKHDSITRGFLNRIKVAAITSEIDPEGLDHYKPYQGFIAEKSYPFIREVYIINRESFSGLGSGFVQFISADKGQRIILKLGMVPATMPIRLIKTRPNY